MLLKLTFKAVFYLYFERKDFLEETVMHFVERYIVVW